jgi:ABC-type Mn2+/Zn2+ transport system permease subunit
LPTLVISIVIAHTPAVAIGAGIVQKGQGMPLIIGAALVSFVVAIVTGYVRRQQEEPLPEEEAQPANKAEKKV